ncbi:hypothetical protein ACQ9BO_10510 [Flavobacterium sp. P21]|uniref:hypothetical protein n=1 Tax=Flavobacterium sp. P21 TaxID=3423948 RepID=UPI003D664D51
MLLKKSTPIKDFYKDAEFVNKNCTRLEDFIINDELNGYDLRKLADLNGIDLQIQSGWYPMTIALLKELDNDGWDKTVSCIKEKYAELRFYADHRHRKILNKYEEKSRRICETCGKSGDQRGSSFIYVACRKHYLEDRGQIIIENSGFIYKGTSYLWDDILNIIFENKDHNDMYKYLFIGFKKPIIKHERGYPDNVLKINNQTVGFGNLLNNLPLTLKRFQYYYPYIEEKFRKVEFCEICGYKAVYSDKCECCEYTPWKSYKNRWNAEEAEKNDYISRNQIYWIVDEGEIFERRQNNYIKNPDHKILFTEKQLKEYVEYLEDDEYYDD